MLLIMDAGFQMSIITAPPHKHRGFCTEFINECSPPPINNKNKQKHKSDETLTAIKLQVIQ